MYYTKASLENERYLSRINLGYLAFLVLPFFFAKSVTTTQIVVTAVSVLLFLPLYFLTYRVSGRRTIAIAFGQVLLCFAVLPFNPGGNTYLIYAVINVAYHATARNSVLFLIASLLFMLVETHLLKYPFVFFVSTAILAGMLVIYTLYGRQMAINQHHLKLSQQEVQRLAQQAERERIARDLHDVLGHTMSLIVMKSELAGRLFSRDAAASLVQIQEVERIARESLDQIRSAVSGIRLAKLEAELANARLNLLAASIHLHYQLPAISLPTEIETTLALIVREAITNIIRHAGANRVEIEMQQVNNTLQLHISDDGKGGDIVAGNGIGGMRERLQIIAGDLSIDKSASGGLRLSIHCPLPPTPTGD